MLSRKELTGLQAMALAKHIAHIEEMREKFTKEKIRRTLQLEKDLQHKIEKFDLGPESFVLVKNSAIKMFTNKKMKPRYLGSMVVMRKLQGDTYILAKLNSSVTNFIWPYLHQFFDNSHSLNSYRKPSKKPFG